MNEMEIRETQLTGTELAILLWLRENGKAKALGTHWWSLRKIGEGVNHSASTVLRAVHVLEREKMIKIHHGPGNAYGYEIL